MRVIIIRHGRTQGNALGWYLGRTDEPLCGEGIAQVEEAAQEVAALGVTSARVYVSPLERARQTARILFPGAVQVPVEGFAEMDFGAFEAKSHAELDGDPAYQRWIDSFCELPCPGGEDKAGFMARNVQALEDVLSQTQGEGAGPVVVVAHGGTVMSCFNGMAENPRRYYDWRSPNCGGYAADACLEDGRWVLRNCTAFDRVAQVLPVAREEGDA